MFLIDASPAMFRPAPASIAASGDNRVATHTGGNALLLGAKRSLGRARLHENATRAGLKFDAGTRVRRLVRLCCDDDVCK